MKLQRIRSYLATAGHPEKKIRIIHVAGTVGKGSTSVFAASLLRAAGLRTGVFLSPHLVDYTERIQIYDHASRQIPQQRFMDYFSHIRRNSFGKKLTPFEILTAMAVHYFVDEGVEAAVFEVGLGGRLDATNALKTEVSVITRIGMDHMHWLGNTLEKIAAEKFAIIRPGVPVVMAPHEAALYRSLPASRFTPHASPFALHVPRPIALPTTAQLSGTHQRQNAALSLKAVEIFLGRQLSALERHAGLSQAFIPGRLQRLRAKPPLILDGAHNEDSAHILAVFLRRNYPRLRWNFVVGILERKDASAILRHLSPLALRFLWVPVPGNPCHSATELDQLLKKQKKPPPANACRSWKEALRKTGMRPVCITGSLYLAGNVLRQLGRHKALRSSI